MTLTILNVPASYLAIMVLTVGAVIILIFATQLSRASGTLIVLGLFAIAMAAVPALLGGSPELLAVVGVCALSALALLLLPSLELEDDVQRVEIAALLLLGAAGAIALATADNLLSLALGLETLSLSVAIVTALGRGERPLEAAFKYFVLAAVSLATLIYGIGLYVLATGSLSLATRPSLDPSLQPVYFAAVTLITLGFAFELAVVPVHWGALGAYMAAAPGLAGYVMSVGKLGAVLALSRLALMVGLPVDSVLVAAGVVSIGWGTFAALAQRDLRGLLGYSAIAHAGFLALALGCGAEGRLAAVFYVVTYAVTVMLVFAALAGLGNSPLQFDALSRANLDPLRGLALGLGLLSLAGIPPTPGFWAKLAILGPAWFVAGPAPTLVAVIGGVAGALYYLKPLPDLWASLRPTFRQPSGNLTGLAMLLAGAVVVVFGLAPGLAYVLAVLSQAKV
jgi:NADH-quinone oxidoreductase subunit N